MLHRRLHAPVDEYETHGERRHGPLPRLRRAWRRCVRGREALLGQLVA
ncbi:MAG: hypothetical protein M3462_04215 [Chloroflexota bacterium]|nr:hypothetical protein [Chloroflexota bacterium]